MNSGFYNCKTLGKTLKEVAVDLIQTSSEKIVSKWYHSQLNVDLFTWVDRGENVIKQQLSFNGQVIEWNCLEGIKTGVVIEADIEGSKETSESIQFDTAPHESAVKLAIEILVYFETDKKLYDQLLSNFKNPQNIKTLSPEEFVKRFGMALRNYQTQDQGFWDSFKKTFQHIFKKTG
ncbi:MAG: hypothetical protein IPM57_06835 [Oligoflexia bacterium]|nr:hypothetical protein [Oligoflexia bacterium]